MERDLTTLMTFDIALTLTDILLCFACAWVIIRQSIHSTREISQQTREITQQTREITQMQREVAFMIRRQYGDIDQDLQEIKELLEGR